MQEQSITDNKHRVIHRYAMSGGARCGAEPDRGKTIRISTSGVGITCPDCVALDAPLDRQAALAQLHAAAEHYRTS